MVNIIQNLRNAKWIKINMIYLGRNSTY
jgi:hypothetical protein